MRRVVAAVATLTVLAAAPAATASAAANPVHAALRAPQAAEPGQAVTFSLRRTSVAAGDKVASWRLDFGDGSHAAGRGAPPRTVTHTFGGAGTFRAILRVTDVHRHTGRARAEVTVTAPPVAPVPVPVPAPTVEPTASPTPAETLSPAAAAPATATPAPTPSATATGAYLAVSGRVTDARSGAPLVHVPVAVSSYCNCDATVTSTDTTGAYTLWVPATSFTDSHGRSVPVVVEADQQPDDAVTWPAGTGRDTAYAPGYATAVRGDAGWTADLALGGGAALTGRATHKDKGVAGTFAVRVVMQSETFRFSVATADGSFSLANLPPGTGDAWTFTPRDGSLAAVGGTCDTTGNAVTVRVPVG